MKNRDLSQSLARTVHEVIRTHASTETSSKVDLKAIGILQKIGFVGIKRNDLKGGMDASIPEGCGVSLEMEAKKFKLIFTQNEKSVICDSGDVLFVEQPPVGSTLMEVSCKGVRLNWEFLCRSGKKEEKSFSVMQAQLVS